jgi:hypothetical protein
MEQPLRVCLCGRPYKHSQQMRLGRTANAELKNFSESLELAESTRMGVAKPYRN